MKTKVLHMHEQGPLIEYSTGVLTVQSLHPFNEIRWRFSRKEMFRLAWRSFLTAIS